MGVRLVTEEYLVINVNAFLEHIQRYHFHHEPDDESDFYLAYMPILSRLISVNGLILREFMFSDTELLPKAEELIKILKKKKIDVSDIDDFYYVVDNKRGVA